MRRAHYYRKKTEECRLQAAAVQRRTNRAASERAEVWCKFREALDPDQPDGSAIALPPDPEVSFH
jgi:hypothetical protein